MTIQLSVECRNAANDAYETAIGASPILTIRSGAAPANTAAANSGTVLATLALPADWMGASAAGVKAMLGSWADAAADATGTAAHFRIHNNGNTVCHMQGTVGTSAADMIVDSTSFTAGQAFSVTAFNLTAGGA